MRPIHSILLLTLLTFIFGSGCSNSGKPPETGSNPSSPSAPSSASAPSASSGTVVNRTEQFGGLSYKIYFQETATAANRKGIVLFGSGNNEDDPTTGSLDDALENNAANELAKLGYVAAIVAYRDEPPAKTDDDWNKNCEMLATDMSQVADHLIATVGGGLSRNKVVTGGVSYASYALLTNISGSNTLADTRGVLSTCGATQDLNPKVPIFSLNCSPNPEGDFNGQTLIDKIPDPKIKADSGFFADTACATHCGGDTNTWTSKLVERVQTWLP